MKRYVVGVLIALVALGAVTVGQASITVNWNNSNAIEVFGGGPNLANGNVIQLIWSMDGVINPIANDSTPTVNDGLLATGAVGDGGTPAGWGLWQHPSDVFLWTDVTVGYSPANDAEFTNGYVYVRVYDTTIAPTVGDNYLEGGLTGGPLFNNPGSPPEYDIANISPTVPLALNQTIAAAAIPEPGTLALMGIGLLTVAARRKRKK